MLPKLKKEVKAFLSREEGKITKDSLLRAGIVAAAASIGLSQDVSAGWTHTSSCGSAGWASGDPDNCFGGPPPEYSCYEGSPAGSVVGHVNNAVPALASGPITFAHAHCADTFTWPAHYNNWHKSCCFAEGTKVMTKDGHRLIEDLLPGDKILSYDIENKKLENAEVEDIESPIREGVYLLNNKLRITDEHPLYCKKQNGGIGWAAIDPDSAEHSHNIDQILPLELGDSIFTNDGKWIEVDSIEYQEGKIQTYNLKKVTKNMNFFAEGLLVHNKGMM